MRHPTATDGSHILRIALTLLLCVLSTTAVAADACPTRGVTIQVLGSGGPELAGSRASSSYLVWHDGVARVLIDSGGGSALRFAQSGARFDDLDAILFTHLHADHSADFPVLIKASFFGERRRPLPVYGPAGNDLLPATGEFVRRLFDARQGLYPYLSDFLDGSASYQIEAHDIAGQDGRVIEVRRDAQLHLQAIPVVHGDLPALAWLVEIGGKRIAFSGDMNGDDGHLEVLARNADLLVAHHAIPEGLEGVARRLHMPPTVIGRIAASAGVKQLVLSHRMQRTLGTEADTLRHIRRSYGGGARFADDLDCFQP